MTDAAYKKYIRHSAATAAFCIISVASINMLADPYNLFGTVKIERFNALKAVISSKQRVFETVQLLRKPYDVVILGTSRTDIGISPRHPAFPQGKTFNAAMSGQQMSESREILEAMIARGHTPKTVVMGLDFMGFNALMPVPFDYSKDNFSPWRSTELLFSISGLLDSVRTVLKQDRYAIISRGGLLHDDGWRESIGNPAMQARPRFNGSDDGYLRFSYKPAPACRWSTTNAHGVDMIRDYRRLLELAHTHTIDLKLFISPSHARQWETLAAAGLWEQFEDWKRQLVRINSEMAQKYGHALLPLWDFSGYNSVTTVPIPDDVVDIPYYWESSHYRVEVGDWVINRLFGIKSGYPSDFGMILSEKNIGSWLKSTRQLRENYGKTHPRDVQEIDKLAKNASIDGPCAKK